jgi:hypothetical protein
MFIKIFYCFYYSFISSKFVIKFMKNISCVKIFSLIVFIFFVGSKKQNKFPQFCTTLSCHKAKSFLILIFFNIISVCPSSFYTCCQLVYIRYKIATIHPLSGRLAKVSLILYSPKYIHFFLQITEKSGYISKKIPDEKFKRDCSTLYFGKIILSLLSPQHPYNQDTKTCCTESA